MSLHGLSAGQIVDVCDAGASSSPAARGWILAAAGLAEATARDLDGLLLGDRERFLLELRRATFGETLAGRVVCPVCGYALAIQVDIQQLIDDNSTPRSPSDAGLVVENDGLRVHAKPPTLADLAQAERAGDSDAVRAALLEVCVVAATGPSGPIASSELSEEVAAAVGQAIVADNPFVEVCVEPACAACGAVWSCILDAASWLWEEVAATGVRLLDDVHFLAGAYGWSEDQVLELSTPRRRAYVERVVGG